MTSIQNELMTDEGTVCQTRFHWMMLSASVVALMFFVAVSVSSLIDRDIMMFALSLNFTILIFLKVISLLVYYTKSEFAVTNRRVFLTKPGFIRRKLLKIPLNEIRDIDIEQGPLGRMLGYGNIVVIGVDGRKQSFKKISDPFLFSSKIQDQIKQAK